MPDLSPTVLVGRNPVREALERGDGRVEKVLMQRGAHGSGIDAIRRLAREAGVPVQSVPAQRVEGLAPRQVHQGIVAIVAPVAYADLDEMLAGVAANLDVVRETKPILVALDEIEDPHNFGAILRSTVAAGGAGVVVPERRMAPLSQTAVKASAGTALRLPIARVSSLAAALEQAKERGYWVVGLEGGAALRGDPERFTVWTYDWDRPVVLVVGNEGRGLRPGVRAACDALVEIPIRGEAESLNASVAAGVALFASARTRGAAGGPGDSGLEAGEESTT